MKKIFTLVVGLFGLVSAANAASIDDVAVCKHSYVLVCDDYTNNGGGSRVKGALFGNGFFLDVTGGSVANNKGNATLADASTLSSYNYGDSAALAALAAKYPDYKASQFNSLRLKNTQDVIAMKITAKSKLIFIGQGNNKAGKDARIPKIAKDASLNDVLNANDDPAKSGNANSTPAGYVYTWTADDDYTIYIGSYNGDMFLSYIIVEANEAPGTPVVKVGDQTYENGLWYREVKCTPVQVEEDGEKAPTVVTYTLDGSAPTAASPVYTEPIKCYQDMVVKFQAYGDFMGDGKADEDFKCDGADNEGIVNFSFNAPSISANGAEVTITSQYEGAKNYATYLDQADVETSKFTLTESSTVTAYSKIVNGKYATFTTKSTVMDVYVLSPIKEQKVIAATGTAELDEEATAKATDGKKVYVVNDGAIDVDTKEFFVKNLEFGALANAREDLVKYQVPAGQEAYIKMNNTNISFLVAEGDSCDIEVVCSKNSCKNIDSEIAEGATAKDSTTHFSNLMCMVNVSGTNYGDTIYVGNNKENLDTYRNVIKFRVGEGIKTFQKYSGTGNILVSSITLTPVIAAGIQDMKASEAVETKKIMVNGKFMIQTSKGTFNAAGIRIK